MKKVECIIKRQERREDYTMEKNINKEAQEIKSPVTYAQLEAACREAARVNADKEGVFAKEFLDVMGEKGSVFARYNKQTRLASYDEMADLAALFTRRQYSAQYPREDKKNGGYAIVGRPTPFNIPEYIDHKGKDFAQGTSFMDAATGLTTAIMRYVQSEVTFDAKGGKKSVPVGTVVDALKKVVEVVGIETVYARVRDAKFLAFTVTGGCGTLGKMRDIKCDRVIAALVGMYESQLTGTPYAFETQAKENEPAPAPAVKSHKAKASK